MDITPNMLARWILLMYFCINFKLTATEEDCSPVYVRWARVRLNLTARVAGPYNLDNCTRSCTSGHNPARPSYPIECYGFNHKQGANSLSHDCQLFQREQLQNVDGHVEADDRYSFYWKYCAKTTKMCKSQYQFDFYIDRFMDSSEVQRTINTDKVEDCLSRCLDETSFTCRSVSFNRTANVCSLSSQSQVTKPGYLRVNNNPNYRIDYYENNCFNESFTFHHDCRDNGVVVSVESKFPYTGALYGLYDFFTCRIEPKDELRFSLFFPYSTYSKNCTDSFSQKENNNVLDVVLSTDGMDPLYFLTDQDMLYQAKCPITSNSIAAAPTAVGATVVFVVPPGSSPSTSFETSERQTLSTFRTASTSLPITSERFSTFSTKNEISSTDSTDTSIVYETSTKEQSKSVELAKKPVYTLPVIDFTPDVEKSITDDSLILGRGSKITVIVNYPKNNWNDSDDDDDSTTKALNIATESSSLASESTTVSRDVKTWKGSWEKIDHSESSTIRSSTVTHERSSTFTPYEKPPKLVLRGDNDDFAASSTARFSSLTSTASSPLIGKTETRSPTTIVSTVRSSSPSTTSVSSSSSSTSTTVASTSTSESASTSESTSTRTVATTQSTETSGSPSSTSTTSPSQKTTSSESLESLNRFTKEWYNSRFDPFGNIGKPINSESATSPSFASTSSETTSTLSASTLSLTTTPATTTIPSTTTATTTTAKASTNFEKGFDKLSTSSPTNGIFGTSRSTTSSTTQNVSLKSNSNSNNSTSNILHTTSPPQKILFDIYHNNQPVNAVVVGSRIILTFTPGLGVPAPYVSIIGCQVEPVNSPYAFEKDPLQIIKNGCQADGVGLVCPPARTDYGIKIEMEAFRYTTTSEVLYSCIVRICAFNPCPQPFCNPVDGCYAPNNAASPVLLNSPGLLNGNSGFNSPGLINNPGFNGFINNQGVNSPGFANSPGSFGSAGRRKRQQQRPSPFLPLVPAFQVPGAFQQNLLGSAGDILVSKRLVVVNSDIELQYYLRTGNVPTNNNFNGLLGR